MQAGHLRSRITIKRPTVTGQNTSGEDIVTLTTLGSYYADIQAMKGRELEAAQQIWAEARFKIRMRFAPSQTFQRKDRITWGTRTLDILDSEDPDQRNRELIIYAQEFTS